MMKRMMWMVIAAVLGVALQAQDKPKILRFEPNGPAGRGLVGNDRDKSKVHYYYRSKADERVSAGVWFSPDFSGRMHKATNTEFIYILEGSVTFEDKSGREENFKVGDAVLIPRGTEFVWKRTDNEKEYWAIFDRETAGTPAPQGTPTFFRLDRDGPAGKGLVGTGRTKEHEVLRRARWFVGRRLGDAAVHGADLSHDEVRRADGVFRGQCDTDHTGRPDGAVHGRGCCARAEGHRVQMEQRHDAKVLGHLRQRPAEARDGRSARTVNPGPLSVCSCAPPAGVLQRSRARPRRRARRRA